MTTVSLVGSTGSIATHAIDVLGRHREKYQVVALGGARCADALAAQAWSLHPERVAIADARQADRLAALVPRGTEVLAGTEALAEIARHADMVVNAVVGFAGLPVTLAALEAGRHLALANKESLVAGGPVVRRALATTGAEIIPLDSDHCAIHRCLQAIGGARSRRLRRIVLTARDGPFRGRRGDELAAVTMTDALADPTGWMGTKHMVDASTLMDKGLEVIEAHELFGVGYDAIEVVVHSQSSVPSLIQTTDGSTLARLSRPDTRLAIAYALAYPDGAGTDSGAIDWSVTAHLDGELADRDRFPSLDLAYAAGRAGGTAPAALNAANEVAVAAFLNGKIPWVAITEVIAETLASITVTDPTTVEDILAADADARQHASMAVFRRREVGWARHALAAPYR